MDGFIVLATFIIFAPFIYKFTKLWQVSLCTALAPLFVLASCYFGAMSKFADKDVISFISYIAMISVTAFVAWLIIRAYAAYRFSGK